MHTIWQKEIVNYALFGLAIFILIAQKNQIDITLVIVISLLFTLTMTAIWWLAGSKHYWSWRGYTFSHGNIIAIERLARRAGRTYFLLRPGTNEFVKIDLEIEFMTTDTIAQTSHTQLWIREFYRYLTDIKDGHYQYRQPDYHVGDTVEVFFKDTDPTNIRIW